MVFHGIGKEDPSRGWLRLGLYRDWQCMQDDGSSTNRIGCV